MQRAVSCLYPRPWACPWAAPSPQAQFPTTTWHYKLVDRFWSLNALELDHHYRQGQSAPIELQLCILQLWTAHWWPSCGVQYLWVLNSYYFVPQFCHRTIFTNSLHNLLHAMASTIDQWSQITLGAQELLHCSVPMGSERDSSSHQLQNLYLHNSAWWNWNDGRDWPSP